MSVKVGDTVYLWAHAYLRYVGRVSEVLGVRRVSLEDASIIHGDEGYEQLMSRGVVEGKTSYAYVGRVKDTAYLSALEFPHKLPTKRKK